MILIYDLIDFTEIDGLMSDSFLRRIDASTHGCCIVLYRLASNGRVQFLYYYTAAAISSQSIVYDYYSSKIALKYINEIHYNYVYRTSY